MNPVSVADVQARFPRTFTEAEASLAQSFLDDAWEEVVSRVEGVEARIDSGELRVGLVVKVLANAVKAVMLNPTGVLETQIDDYRERRDAAVSTGMLSFSDADLAVLQPLDGTGGSFTVVLGWS